MTTSKTGVPMQLCDENYRFGIEEEFFVVDAATKLAVRSMPREFARAVRAELGGQVTSELLQSQIEIATLPHTDAAEARAELRFLRRVVGEVAADHGLAILAAGTHPTAMWTAQRQTESLRYDAVMHDLQMLGQRNQLCGLHVHCELPDPDERVDVMGRMLPYVPLLVALSTSSPFWQARRTGLMGYRLAAYDELPRTGLPELFRTREDFEAYVRTLVEARIIEDSSYVWWAIRPSMRHPTLELRAPDCCTRVEDALAVASLYRALCRRLVRLPQLNADLSAIDRAIIAENKWRAQRYGIHGSFVDPTRGRAVPVTDLIEQVVDEVACDAMELGVMPEVMHARDIAGTGTSADTQIAIFEEARGRTASERRALDAVKEWIATATLQ